MSSNRSRDYKQPPSYPLKQNSSAKQGNRRPLLRRRFIVLSIVAGLFIYWAGSSWLEQQAALQQQNVKLEEAQSLLHEALARQHDLNQQVTSLHDYEYIAEIARKDYFLSKPGEMIFKIQEK